MITPIITVHTICDELKYGAMSLLAPSSTAITDIPEKNSVRYKKYLLRMSLFSMQGLPVASVCAVSGAVRAIIARSRSGTQCFCRIFILPAHIPLWGAYRWSNISQECCCMKGNMEERARTLAAYIIENRATVRAAAKKYGVSKSTVHKDLQDRLPQFDRCLYLQVKEVLDENKAQRHIRGGMATRKKYKGI